MDEKERKITNFMEVTGSSKEIALNFVENAGYEINVAVDAFYEQYAPIKSGSSEEYPDMMMQIKYDAQNRAMKHQNDLELLIISSDEEDAVICVEANRAKKSKLELTPAFEFPPWSPNFERRNSTGSSLRASTTKATEVRRKILIDGSNVAVSYAKSLHGRDYNRNKRDGFSVEGLQICIEYFKSKGFEVRAIVPEYRLKHDKSSNCRLIHQLKEEGSLIVTPAKSYDDGILLKSAVRLNAAIVSNDFFRKL